MMVEIRQRILGGFGMPVEWAVSIVVPIFKGKGDIRNCSCYGVVKLLENEIKVVERVLEKRLCAILTIELQFSSMPERETIDIVFIFRSLQEECHAKGRKLCVL